MVRPKPGDKASYDVAELEGKIAQIVRNWHDELRDTLVQRHGEEKGLKLASRFGRALPVGYIEEVTPHVAASDVERAAALRDADDIRISLYRSRRKADTLHFKVFRLGADIATISSHLARDPRLAPLVAKRPGLRAPGEWDRETTGACLSADAPSAWRPWHAYAAQHLRMAEHG